MKRCFVGLRIRDDARRELDSVADALRALPPTAARKLRPLEATSLHVTLKFLGPTPDAHLPDIIETLTEVATGFPEVAASLTGLGAFPSPVRPRIVWAGLAAGRERIVDLMTHIDEACEILGFEPETRAPHPHVTVARVERPEPRGPLSELIAAHADRALGSVDGRSLVLFESQLQPGGAVYVPLAELSFQG